MTFPCNPRIWRLYKPDLWEPLGRHTTHITHSEPTLVTRRIAIRVIYNIIRVLLLSWNLDLGKLFYPVPVNLLPYPKSLNTHCEDPLHGVLVVNTTIVGAHHGARGASGSTTGED